MMEDLDRALLAIRCNDETGLPLGIVLELDRGAFHPAAGRLDVLLTDQGSSGRRSFRLSRLLRRGLARMLTESLPGARLFTGRSGSPLALEAVRALWADRQGSKPGEVQGPPGRASLWQGDLASQYMAQREALRIREILNRALEGLVRPRLLEVGCGHGRSLMEFHRERIAPLDGLSVGVDVVPETVLQARGGGGGTASLHWLVADARRLPLVSGSVDVVLAQSVVEHFPLPAVLLGEVARCLRPGGTLIATTNHPGGACIRLAALRRWVQSWGPEGGLGLLRRGYQPMVDPCEREKEGVYGHVSVLPPAEWKAILESCGMDLRSAEGVTFTAPSLFFTRHPAALALLRAADGILDFAPGALSLCTGLCYVAVKPR